MPTTTRPSALLPVLLASVVLAFGVNLAAEAGPAPAARKKPVLAGAVTETRQATTLKRLGRGPALTLATKRSTPPMKVTSRARIDRLNADQVDGLNADDLLTRTYAYTLPSESPSPSDRVYTFPDLPPGQYSVDWSVIFRGTDLSGFTLCYLIPAGTAPTGLGYAVPNSAAGFATASGSATVDTTDGPVTMRCQARSAWRLDSEFDSPVSFTRTELVEGAVSTASPRTAPRSGPAAVR